MANLLDQRMGSGAGPTACDNPADPPPGASQYGPNYGYMGDVGLEECQAKAEEMQSPCFDYSPKGNGRAGYQSVWDPVTQSWSLFNPAQKLWMGYDDPRAVLAKGRFVRDQGLAGVFAWELSQDNGDLLNAMNRGVGNVPLATQKEPRR